MRKNEQKFYSRTQLAQMCGVSPKTFSRWMKRNGKVKKAVAECAEGGSGLLPPKVVQVICEELDIER